MAWAHQEAWPGVSRYTMVCIVAWGGPCCNAPSREGVRYRVTVGAHMSTKCHYSIFGRNCEMIIYGILNVVIEQE